MARVLVETDSAEARRTATDRAYYAVFLFSRDELERKGYRTFLHSADDHRDVAEELKRLLRTLGGDENLLRLARNDATYRTDALYMYRGWPTKPIHWVIDTAQRIIDAVAALPENPTPRR